MNHKSLKPLNNNFQPGSKLDEKIENPADADPAAGIRRDLLFDIATSMFERSFVTYRFAPSGIKRSQWPGWAAYIAHFSCREDYRNWWRKNVLDFETSRWIEGCTQYDLEFERFMRKNLQNAADKQK